MKLENTKAQLRKGILELCILTILDKKEAYPSEILEAKRSEVDCGGGNALSIANALKKWRTSNVQMGRITFGPAPQVLFAHQIGARIFGGTLLDMGRTQHSSDVNYQKH